VMSCTVDSSLMLAMIGDGRRKPLLPVLCLCVAWPNIAVEIFDEQLVWRHASPLECLYNSVERAGGQAGLA
jgi:hypothetical protein